jgi:hypothetical protein
VYSVYSWVTPFDVNSFKPLAWYWAVYPSGFHLEWLAQPNPAIEYLMFPMLVLLPLFWLKRKDSVASMCWLWLLCSFGPWFIADFFVRFEANFYIVYSLPALAIGCAYIYSMVKARKLRVGLAFTHLIFGMLIFFYYFPIPLLR